MGWLGIFDSRNLEVQRRTRDVWGQDHFDLEVMYREDQSLTMEFSRRVSLQEDHRFVLGVPNLTMVRGLFAPPRPSPGLFTGGRQGPWRVTGRAPRYELSHDTWCLVLLGFTDPKSAWVRGWVSHKVLFSTLMMDVGEDGDEWL